MQCELAAHCQVWGELLVLFKGEVWWLWWDLNGKLVKPQKCACCFARFEISIALHVCGSRYWRSCNNVDSGEGKTNTMSWMYFKGSFHYPSPHPMCTQVLEEWQMTLLSAINFSSPESQN